MNEKYLQIRKFILESIKDNIAKKQIELVSDVINKYQNVSKNYVDNIINDLIVESILWRTRIEKHDNELFLFMERR